MARSKKPSPSRSATAGPMTLPPVPNEAEIVTTEAPMSAPILPTEAELLRGSFAVDGVGVNDLPSPGLVEKATGKRLGVVA
jgi:hypothetical protein